MASLNSQSPDVREAVPHQFHLASRAMWRMGGVNLKQSEQRSKKYVSD